MYVLPLLRKAGWTDEQITEQRTLRARDILHVKQLLGHKSINNTLIYTHLVTFESDEFHVKTASTLKEACELAEAGFDYFTTIDDVQIFRKRK